MTSDLKNLLLAIIALLLPAQICGQPLSARQTLDKVVARLNAAPGISCGFTLTHSGGSASGTLRAKGTRFVISSPASSAWYDGHYLATYSKATNEITIVRPTLAELRETNPLLYLGAAADYDISYAKSSGTSTRRLLLKARRRGAPARQLLVTVGAASLTPVSIEATLSDGRKVTIRLSNVNLKASIPDAEFKYKKPKSAKVNDLR